MDLKAPISDFMSHSPVTVSPRDRMAVVKDIFENQSIHHVLVVDRASLVGIISKEDYNQLVRRYNRSFNNELAEEARLYNYTVEEIMSTDLVVLEPSERISVALELFYKNHFRAIPIVEGKELNGLLTTYDIIKALVAENRSITVS